MSLQLKTANLRKKNHILVVTCDLHLTLPFIRSVISSHQHTQRFFWYLHFAGNKFIISLRNIIYTNTNCNIQWKNETFLHSHVSDMVSSRFSKKSLNIPLFSSPASAWWSLLLIIFTDNPCKLQPYILFMTTFPFPISHQWPQKVQSSAHYSHIPFSLWWSV